MQKIVVGVDGSEASRNALRWAVEEARLRGARVVALHAWEVPLAAPDVSPAPQLDVAGLVTDLHESAQQLVTSLVDAVVGGDSPVTVEPVAVEGPAASALLDAARDAELLVVGSRGHGGIKGLLLGSVSQECAQQAPCPVVIHHGARPEAG